MAGASYKVTVDDAAVQAALTALLARADDATPAFAAIGESLVTSTQHRFETGTDPDGSAWPVSLRAALQNGQTLADSGRLKDSLTYRAAPQSVEVGTNVIYAAIHQFGGVIRAKSAKALAFTLANGAFVLARQVTMPRRAFLGLDSEDRQEIPATVADWLGGAWSPGGAA